MPEFSDYVEGLDPVVGALAGDELIPASKDGEAVSLTPTQIAALGGGGGTWGSITGTLSSQTDLQNALNLKSNALITFRTETASHTLDATDLASINAGAMLVIQMNVASANTLTVPLNATQAFTVGTVIFVDQIGAGQTTIVATGGVTLNSGDGLVIAVQYAGCVLKKTATDTWTVQGKLVL